MFKQKVTISTKSGQSTPKKPHLATKTQSKKTLKTKITPKKPTSGGSSSITTSTLNKQPLRRFFTQNSPVRDDDNDTQQKTDQNEHPQNSPTTATTTTTTPLVSQFTPPHTNPTYITNPIFYVNGKPHIGHLYTSLLSDTIKSWKKSLGNDTFVMGGTDEHGIKVQEASEKAGYDNPLKFCDDISLEFQKAWEQFDLTPDAFLRTTSPEHTRSVQWMWKQLARNGYIYLGKHSGWYCKSDEVFVPEAQLIKQQNGTFKTPSGHDVVWLEEENFKFRLSEFIEPLLDFYTKNPSSVYPHSQLAQLFAQTDGLQDISISRLSSKLKWSTDVPDGDDVEYWCRETNTYKKSSEITKEKHKVYVWLDALNIYITGARHAAERLNNPQDSLKLTPNAPFTQQQKIEHENSFYHIQDWFAKNPHQRSNQHIAEAYQAAMSPFWPPSMHVIGKDIIKFHAMYWPAFLIGSGLPIPQQVVSHSHWLVNSQKMSKSLGNVVSPDELYNTLGVENTKYALMRLGMIGEDSDFILGHAIATINAELSDTIGNLAMRCTGKAVLPDSTYPDPLSKYRSKTNPRQINIDLAHNDGVIGEEEIKLQNDINTSREIFNNHMSQLRIDRALQSVMDLGRNANAYFSLFEPWKMAKVLKDPEVPQNEKDKIQTKLDIVLYYSIEAARMCSLLLRIVVPKSADVILDQISFPEHNRHLVPEDSFGWHPSLVSPPRTNDANPTTQYPCHVANVPFTKIKPPGTEKVNKGKKGDKSDKKEKKEKKEKKSQLDPQPTPEVAQ
jgi:methionyl-tRNA synthetase